MNTFLNNLYSFSEFQYKVTRSLAEIMETLDKLGLLYELKDSVFHLKQYDDINEFKEFDNGLIEKEKWTSLLRQLFISLILFIFLFIYLFIYLYFDFYGPQYFLFCILIFDKSHNRQKFET